MKRMRLVGPDADTDETDVACDDDDGRAFQLNRTGDSTTQHILCQAAKSLRLWAKSLNRACSLLQLNFRSPT